MSSAVFKTVEGPDALVSGGFDSHALPLLEQKLHPTTTMIEFRNVTKRYSRNGPASVSDLSLQVLDGEICVLVGPSGCGKTTSMKMVNRLIEPTSGEILIDNKPNTSLDPVELRRGIGYVIQQVGLFPHRTISQNIATVPELRGWRKERIRDRVEELLNLVGLDSQTYSNAYPSQLSGGQQQRVGVARALAADPPIMLMDEPFGAVDPVARVRLQDEFLDIQQRVHKTIIFVTHDIDEAIKMGDRIAILRQGGILAQYDTPERLLMEPASDFVASFIGSDRAIKRLSLSAVSALDLQPDPNPTASLPEVAESSSVRDALALLLSADASALRVVSEDGSPTKLLTVDSIKGLLHPESGNQAVVAD